MAMIDPEADTARACMSHEFILGAYLTLLTLGANVAMTGGVSDADRPTFEAWADMLAQSGYEYFEPGQVEGEPMRFMPGHNPGGSLFVRWA